MSRSLLTPPTCTYPTKPLPSISAPPSFPVSEFTGKTGEILDRINTLYPKLIDLSLGRIKALLSHLGHPENKLPPVIHVAGTNGKGSTCATLRAIGEAAGWRVHVMTSPHLITVTERFCVAGQLVSETDLITALEEIERINAGAPITVFEALTAAGFLLFANTPADLAIIEVGLGGRYDATNVLQHPAACAITSISHDHEAFLGNTLDAIATEKAGIFKPHAPAVTGFQPDLVMAVLRDKAQKTKTPLFCRGRNWTLTPSTNDMLFTDSIGSLTLPSPALLGPWQVDNTGLAVATMRQMALHTGLQIPTTAWEGIRHVSWAARMQHLTGTLAHRLPPSWELWLDGGHNPGASVALAQALALWNDRPLHLIVGMKQSKNASGFLTPLIPYATSLWAIREPDQYLALPVEEIVKASNGKAQIGPTLTQALEKITEQHGNTPARVLICGSLYLAGITLKKDELQT